MRVTKVVLGLAGLLLISLIFVSFQAAAHPEQSAKGLVNAPDDPAMAIYDIARLNSGEANTNGIDQVFTRNPTCTLHTDWRDG